MCVRGVYVYTYTPRCTQCRPCPRTLCTIIPPSQWCRRSKSPPSPFSEADLNFRAGYSDESEQLRAEVARLEQALQDLDAQHQESLVQLVRDHKRNTAPGGYGITIDRMLLIIYVYNR